MAFRSLRTCTGFMPVKSPSSLLETASRPSSMSCWVVLRYFVSLFVRPGCSVARTLAAPLFGQVLDGKGIVTKWSALAIKVLLAAHKSVSKPGYSAGASSPRPFVAARPVVHYARGRRPNRAHRLVLRGTAPSTVPAPAVPLGAHSGHPRTLLRSRRTLSTP